MDSSHAYLCHLLVCCSACMSLVYSAEVGNNVSPAWKESELFRVIWNSRIERCLPVYDVSINLTRWSIEHNKPPNNGWHGDVIYLVNDKFGEWPEIDKKGQIINGGVPQRMDLNKHLQAVAKYLQNNISETWRGVGVLDFEAWWPLLEDDVGNILFTKYANYSMQLVREKHPTWNDSMVYTEAAAEFDIAARVLWKKTLDLVKQLRPGQGWGYYRFPLCIKYAPYNSTCPNMFHNDRLKWLWKSSDFLYPSIYFHGGPAKYERARRQQVYNTISETLRCRKKVGRPRLPILAFTRFYSSLYPLMLYDTIDLINSIGLLADMGIEGTIMWGDILGEINKTRCLETKDFVDNVMGPYILEVKKFVSYCSDNICSSHGRCYVINVPRIMENYQNENAIISSLYKEIENNKIEERIEKQIGNFMNDISSQLGKYIVNDYKKKHNLSKVNKSVYKCHCIEGYTGDYCKHQL